VAQLYMEKITCPARAGMRRLAMAKPRDTMDSTKIIRIRQMRVEDSAEVSRLYGTITKQPKTAEFSGLIETCTGGRDYTCFVAECEERIVGFVIGRLLTLSFGWEKSGWITTMEVAPSFREQGIGVDLAQEIVKYYQALGIGAVHASVTWNSGDLISLFRGLDFQRSPFVNLVKQLD
jgi:ribosomal protein S18 acetylase RimI-like enzyme